MKGKNVDGGDRGNSEPKAKKYESGHGKNREGDAVFF